MVGEFKAFLTRSNALALAIGVIIGAATAKLVSAFADDLLMPIIGLIMPGGDWRAAKWVLETATGPDGKVTENAILYGHFLGSILDFVIIAFIVFAITKAALRPDPAVPTKSCPQCLEIIPLGATKCRACASVV
ncbi:MAG TPA: large conductance mechanosensitive channel protein MscL [Thermoanaerobaculia bacterium]|jgi:large conductance mechanosensitive channel|nr:large conductance mechanosensitive channel protein MscL [Thermoanaerobaculia bacterium]